jgi:hypothetical protein
LLPGFDDFLGMTGGSAGATSAATAGGSSPTAAVTSPGSSSPTPASTPVVTPVPTTPPPAPSPLSSRQLRAASLAALAAHHQGTPVNQAGHQQGNQSAKGTGLLGLISGLRRSRRRG